jgi:hypothetical protein
MIAFALWLFELLVSASNRLLYRNTDRIGQHCGSEWQAIKAGAWPLAKGFAE